MTYFLELLRWQIYSWSQFKHLKTAGEKVSILLSSFQSMQEGFLVLPSSEIVGTYSQGYVRKKSMHILLRRTKLQCSLVRRSEMQ